MFKKLIAMLFNQNGFADVPATASTLATLDAAALRRTAWRTKAKEDSVRPSIFTAIKTAFKVVNKEEIMILEHGVVMDVTGDGKNKVGGGQSVVLALRKPLQKAPRMGTGEDMLGNEDETSLCYMTAHYNEIKKSIKYNTWGYDYNDTEYLNYNEGYSRFLGLFWQEWEDYRYHVAGLMGYSPELTYTPVSVSQTFNPNWAIPNLDPGSYPTWDVDAVTETDGSVDSSGYYTDQSYSLEFAENIADALVSAGGTGSTSNAYLDTNHMAEIHAWVEDSHALEPIMMDGIPTYIFAVPPKVWDYMMNPANSNSFGAYLQNVLDYKDEKRAVLPGEMGRIYSSFLMVKDPRCPSLVVGGSDGSYTLTPGYVRPGNNDDRNTSAWSNETDATNYGWHICMLYGAEAFVKYTRDALVTDLVETTEYRKREGRGSYKGCGIQLGKYDIGTPTATSKIYRGSCVVPVSFHAVQA